jgi:hypothetical protein
MKASPSRLTSIVPVLAAPILVALLALTGCKKQEAPPVVVAPLHAPASLADDKGWEAYFQDVISRNSQGVTDHSNAYYLPGPDRSDYDGMYKRQLQGVQDVVARGVMPGNLLAFMSPDSTKMADLVVEAFKGASQGSMKNVVILFVGKEADDDRVHAAVANTGCIYRFVEAK